jgi:hypothetical protein
MAERDLTARAKTDSSASVWWPLRSSCFSFSSRRTHNRRGTFGVRHARSFKRPYLKAAEEFLAMSKTAETPFVRAYYERVALRYLSSEGKLNVLPGQSAATASPRQGTAEHAADEKARPKRGPVPLGGRSVF